MTTKEMAREALQKLHDAYNAIPDDVSEDFDRTHYRNFEKAMDTALTDLRLASDANEEAKMMKDAEEWANQMAKQYGTK